MRNRLLLLALLTLIANPLAAQNTPPQTGTLSVTDWPQSAIEEGLLSLQQVENAGLVPEIESLRMGYELSVHRGRPRLDIQLLWDNGAHGWLDGERVAYEVLPEDVRLESIEVHARVLDGDSAVTDFYVMLDGLDLAPAPAVLQASIDSLDWSDLFPHVTPDSARNVLAQGLVLDRPQILSASFTHDDGFYTQIEDDGGDPRVRPRREPTVVTVDRDIWIDIWITTPPRRIYERPRTVAPRPRGQRARGVDRDQRGHDRSATARRTTSGGSERNDEDDGRTRRTTRSDTSSSRGGGLAGLLDGRDDDEDDDDDESLLPAALVGVAAVGVVAYAAGTIGYYGNAAAAPIGLTAGYVRADGGGLLQVAVNDAVISQSGEPEHLIAKLTGFFDAFNAPLRPAIGLGVHAEEYRGDYDISPTISLGGVWQQGAGVLYLGYDVMAGGVDVGIAFNFRHRRTRP